MVQTYILLEEYTMLRLCAKKNKTSDHKKVWLTCSHGNNYKNSTMSFIDKICKKKTSIRCINCHWSITIQWHFLIKANKNDAMLTTNNEHIEFDKKYNNAMQIFNNICIVE